MLMVGFPFADVWRTLRSGTFAGEAPLRFVRFLERRLGARFMYDAGRIPFENPDLIDLFDIAAALKDAGVITNVQRAYRYADEPGFFQWIAECATVEPSVAGGVSLLSDRDALIPTLAEAVERFIWTSAEDFFVSPHRATAAAMKGSGRHTILPEQFVGFSDMQRKRIPHALLPDDAEYLWTRGYSHTQRRPIWLPAQVVSGAYGIPAIHHGKEPLILSPITTGLATGPTREFALLNGALEIIERDAFMITWLNQLSPPQLDLDELAIRDPAVATLLRRCARYKLSVKAVLLPTDAPAYAVCAVVTDESEAGPNVTVGLKAHRTLASAVIGASLEALRIRQTARLRNRTMPLRESVETRTLVHVERVQYWGRAGSARKLDWLVSGEPIPAPSRAWEGDTIEAHWGRILAWCRESGYECASADVGRSAYNVSPWHIEMVVMPEMQPMHQYEQLAYDAGARLRNVPEKLGYVPQSEPYTREPHPFA